MDTLLNREIKGYEIREKVGAGGFGAVYRAYQPSVGREVAIKVILPQLANQPDFVRRFEVEAQVVARLEHPHIVPLYDYWRDPQGAYLVMRWLRSNLRVSLERSSWSLDAAARLLEQVSSALTIAHREGIVHRDIKPDNILLDEDENAYLADFGIAKDVHLRSAAKVDDEVAGSPAYLSPEQIRSDEVTARTDLYSLGYVVYELLTGEKPFVDAKTPSDYIMKHLSDPMPMMSIQHTHIPAAIDEVLQTVTAKDPSHRYANAQRFAAAFRAALPNKMPRAVAQPLADPLTERELEVLRLMIEGLDNQEIAQRLFLTPSTVKWYVKQVYGKLDAHSRQQAIERALGLKLTETRAALKADPVLLDQPTVHGLEPVIRVIDPENPFKGLRAFQEGDAADFFGRAALTERLLSRMIDGGDSARLFTIVGPSGSGKSSVVRAGLIPALRKGALTTSPHPFIADFMPGTHPLEELEAALLRVAVNPMPGLLEQLKQDRRGLVRAAKRLLPNDNETELILVIDQFEEVFTLVNDEAVRVHFIDNLLSAATDPRGRVRIILTLRADFYDRPLMYPRLAETVRANTEVIIPLTAREMEQAITAPLERVGMSAESGLTATILRDIGEQPGTLPLLQYALTELFERREGMTLTVDAYKATGGVLGALARRAEDIYSSLDEKLQALTRQLFLRMVTLGEGTEDTRRRVLQSEFAALGSETVLEDVLNAFTEYRLLTLDRDPITHGPTVEIAHEALIREWNRLHQWLDESREEIRLQRQLMTLAEDWLTSQQEVSFLLRGARLEIFEKWSQETSLALTEQEKMYLAASIVENQRQQQLAEEQQARELRLAKEATTQQKRAANRLRLLVAVMALAVIGALVLSGITINQRNDAQRSSDQFRSLSLAADSQLARGNYNGDLALNLALAAVDIDNAPARSEMALAQAAYAPGVRWTYHDYPGVAIGLVVSPDGRYVAAGLGRIVSDLPQAEDYSVRLIDLQTREQVQIFEGHVDTIYGIAFSSDGRYLLTGSWDNNVDSPQTSMILWDISTGEALHYYYEDAGWIAEVAFTPDGNHFLSTVWNDDPRPVNVLLRDLETGETVRQIGSDIEGELRASAISPDGHYVVIKYVDSDNEEGQATIAVYDTASGERVREFIGEADGWLHASNHGLLDSGIPMARVWNLDTGELLHEALHNSFLTNQTAWTLSPDGRTAAFGETGGRIQVFDTATWRAIATFINPNTNDVSRLDFTPDGSGLISSGDDGLRYWDLESGTFVRQYGLTTTGSRLRSVMFMPTGQSVIGLGSVPPALMLYDLVSGEMLQNIVYTSDRDFDVAAWGLDVTSDGSMALIGTNDSYALLYDLESGALLRHFTHFDESEAGDHIINGVDISPDDRTALTGAQGDTGMVLWDLTTGAELHRFDTGFESPTFEGVSMASLTFSPDGTTIVAAGQNGILVFYDVQTYAEIRRFVPEIRPHVFDVVFSPDASMILTANGDNTLFLWDVASGTVLYTFVGHSAPVRGAEFSPDGRLAASGSTDGSIILWDVATGQAIRQMYWAESGVVASVNFSADGQFILAGGDYGLMSLWRVDATLDDLTAWTYSNRYISPLTCGQRLLYVIEPLCSVTDDTEPTP